MQLRCRAAMVGCRATGQCANDIVRLSEQLLEGKNAVISASGSSRLHEDMAARVEYQARHWLEPACFALSPSLE